LRVQAALSGLAWPGSLTGTARAELERSGWFASLDIGEFVDSSGVSRCVFRSVYGGL